MQISKAPRFKDYCTMNLNVFTGPGSFIRYFQPFCFEFKPEAAAKYIKSKLNTKDSQYRGLGEKNPKNPWSVQNATKKRKAIEFNELRNC